MLAFLFIAGALIFFVAILLRNALAFALAGFAAAAVWMTTHDLPATCAAAMATLFLASVFLQVCAASQSSVVRGMTLGAEAIAAATASATFAFMLFQEGQSALAITITMSSAALLGAGVAVGNRARQH